MTGARLSRPPAPVGAPGRGRLASWVAAIGFAARAVEADLRAG